MIRTARVTWAIGGIVSVFIGLMHTITHYAELRGQSLRGRFDQLGDIEVSAQTVTSWDLFQGVSLLMGFFCVAAGGLALVILRMTPPATVPPAAAAVIMVALLVTVISVGVVHLGPLQVYGGAAGVVWFGLTLLAHARRRVGSAG